MRNICASNADNLGRLMELDVCNVIMKIVRREVPSEASAGGNTYDHSTYGHKLSEEAVEGLCDALGGLCYDDRLAKEFGQAGLCKMLPLAVKAHVGSEQVAVAFAEVVRNLSACEDPEEHIHCLMDAGAGEALVDALNRFPSNAELAVMASRAIGNLALIDHHKYACSVIEIAFFESFLLSLCTHCTYTNAQDDAGECRGYRGSSPGALKAGEICCNSNHFIPYTTADKCGHDHASQITSSKPPALDIRS